MRNAFTMIELIFVIVVLGILAGVAVPKLAATRDDATIAKMRADIGSIRAGIVNKRNAEMMRGNNQYPALEDGCDGLFCNVLQYGIKDVGVTAKNGWHKVKVEGDVTFYKAAVGGKSTDFTYCVKSVSSGTVNCKAGQFICQSSDALCNTLSN